MSTKARYVYLHGFASSPRARKGTWLADRLALRGAALECPDLNAPSFERLDHDAMLDVVRRLGDEASGERLAIVGSSLGGWVAARFAELYPERVTSLVLLCPGFHLTARWPSMLGHEAFEAWRTTGTRGFLDAEGIERPVHFGFVEAASRHPGAPRPRVPTTIVHGLRDEVVPIETSRAYAAEHTDVRLVEVDGDHGLLDALDVIEREVVRAFAL